MARRAANGTGHPHEAAAASQPPDHAAAAAAIEGYSGTHNDSNNSMGGLEILAEATAHSTTASPEISTWSAAPNAAKAVARAAHAVGAAPPASASGNGHSRATVHAQAIVAQSSADEQAAQAAQQAAQQGIAQPPPAPQWGESVLPTHPMVEGGHLVGESPMFLRQTTGQNTARNTARNSAGK